MKETFCEILHLVFHSTLKVTRCILLLWQLCKRTKILVKWDFNLYLKSEYVHTSLPLSCKYNHHPNITKFCFLILQSHCLFYNQNVMVKLSSFEVLILDSNNCVHIHSWFKSKSVQNNFKVAQVWFVFLFAQELSRNDQLSRTKEKNKLQVQNHFNTNSLSLTCTHTTWALEQLYKHCRALLWEPSTLKLWNQGYPAYAFYQKTMIP